MENTETPEWLDDLQQRSWEPEVLLSGIVLFGMFKVPPLLDKAFVFFSTQVFSSSNEIGNLVGIFKMGIYWLISGLILHLICRGIWVGMVGLSYTFPHGVNTERLKFKHRFKMRVENIPPFQRLIISLEKLCSSLFSLSFMLFMSVVGGYLYFLVLLVVPIFSAIAIFGNDHFTGTVLFQIYVVTVVVLAVIGLVDFLTLGFFRRFSFVAKIYWPLHQVISTVTLGRFYRPVYFAFVSNINKWGIFALLTVFTVVSIFWMDETAGNDLSTNNISQLSLWHSSDRELRAYAGYYDDQFDDVFSFQAQIPSDVIEGNVLKLFIPAGVNREDSIRKFSNYDSLATAANDKMTSAAIDMMAIKKFYHVYLDDSLWTGYPLLYHFKLKTSQPGYLAYIDISQLPPGMHTVEVGGPPKMYRTLFATIPFYREVDKTSMPELRTATPDDEPYFQVKPGLPR